MADTLAQLIRKKFPGSYDGVDDTKLEEAWIKKYPGSYDHLRTKSAPQVDEGPANYVDEGPPNPTGGATGEWTGPMTLKGFGKNVIEDTGEATRNLVKGTANAAGSVYETGRRLVKGEDDPTGPLLDTIGNTIGGFANRGKAILSHPIEELYNHPAQTGLDLWGAKALAGSGARMLKGPVSRVASDAADFSGVGVQDTSAVWPETPMGIGRGPRSSLHSDSPVTGFPGLFPLEAERRAGVGNRGLSLDPAVLDIKPFRATSTELPPSSVGEGVSPLVGEGPIIADLPVKKVVKDPETQVKSEQTVGWKPGRIGYSSGRPPSRMWGEPHMAAEVEGTPATSPAQSPDSAPAGAAPAATPEPAYQQGKLPGEVRAERYPWGVADDWSSGHEPGSPEAGRSQSLHLADAERDANYRRGIMDEKGFVNADLLYQMLAAYLGVKGATSGARLAGRGLRATTPYLRPALRPTLGAVNAARLSESADDR